MVPNNLPALIRPVWVRRVDIISNHFYEKFMRLYWPAPYWRSYRCDISTAYSDIEFKWRHDMIGR